MNGSKVLTALFSIPRALRSFRLDYAVLALFVASLALVCFVGGAYVAEFDVPWYQRHLKRSFNGLRAVEEKYSKQWKSDGWLKSRDKKTGLGDYDPSLAYNGVTLYTSMGAFPTAQLISMQGDVVHQWQLPYDKAWHSSHKKTSKKMEERMHWRRVQLLPDGSVLAIYNVLGMTPYGVGLVKLNKDSELVWRYDGSVHHDFDVHPSGKIYGLTHEIRNEKFDPAPHWRAPMLEDFVVVLSPEGEELIKVSIFEAFANSKFKQCLETIRSEAKGDHTHTNDVEIITPAFAKHHEFCKPGDVFISLRNTSILAVLDLERKEIVWAGRGIWENQHDPDVLDNGNLLIFDNRGGDGIGGYSRILEWNPTSGVVAWSYDGTAEKPFDSNARGCQQLLPNGNLLITESNNGRILEVNRKGDVVWEFYNPHRAGKHNELVAVMYSAQRYATDTLTFLTPEQIAKANGSSASMTSIASPHAAR